MSTPAAGSRANCAIEGLEVGEEMTVCPHCGSRTQILRDFVSERLEQCLHCGQRFSVTDAEEDDPSDLGDIEVVDEATGEVVGTTAPPVPGLAAAELDALLQELGAGVPEASQEDLNHLFGIKTAPPSPYGEEFGSFG